MSNEITLCRLCNCEMAVGDDGLCDWCHEALYDMEDEWDDKEPPDDFVDAWDEYSGEYDR